MKADHFWMTRAAWAAMPSVRAFRVYCQLVRAVELGRRPSYAWIGAECFGLEGQSARRAARREIAELTAAGLVEIVGNRAGDLIVKLRNLEGKGENSMETSRVELMAHIPKELATARITASAFRVYCYLARIAGAGHDVYPSYLTIGRECGLVSAEAADATARQRARDVMVELKRCGMVEVEHRGFDGKQSSNIYRLTDPARWVFEVKPSKVQGRAEEDTTASNTGEWSSGPSDAVPVAPGLFDEVNQTPEFDRGYYDRLIRADTEAVRIYREASGVKPNREQVALINERIVDLTKWRESVKTWLQRGYKPANVAGIVGFYDEGDRNDRGKKPAMEAGSIFNNWLKRGK